MYNPFHVDWPQYLPDIATGIRWTLQFTVVSFVLAAVWGLVLALARGARVPLIRWLAYGYTELFKNVPIITEIFVIYYGLGQVGITLGTFSAGVISLVLFYGAYLAEIFRGALQSVPETQKEASAALGFTPWQITRQVVLPQAVRVAMPGTATMLVDLLKSTSLLITIAAAELMNQAQTIASETFRPMEVYVVIGAIYFAICFPLSHLALLTEKKLSAGTPLWPARRRLLREISARCVVPGSASTR
ncbi:MAG TPA: amino acid ABC transporter permease [Bradyrhizobium sp.]|nr:amino acid ABC transporter permease [Bradyrhizobium sp.]